MHLRESLIPAIITVAMHITLLVFITWGWAQKSDEKVLIKPKVIEASLVKLKQQSKAPEKKSPSIEKKEAEERKEAEQKKKFEIEKKRRAEAEKQRQARELALQRKKQAEEKKRKEAEEKRKAEEERKKREQLERERKEQERLAREKREREEQQRRNRELQEKQAAEAAEQARLLNQQHAEMAMSYTGLVKKLVERQWTQPPSACQGMRTELSVRLLPSGDVNTVNVLKSSGNKTFDDSAVRAVEKAGPFHELADLYRQEPRVFDKYFRNFRFVFAPTNLRRQCN